MTAAVLMELKFNPDYVNNDSTNNDNIISRNASSSTDDQFISRYFSGKAKEGKKTENLAKLEEFELLQKNWNFHEANSFSKRLINLCRNLLSSLRAQPDVFPTGRDSIQFEYEKENGEYLEFEIFEDHIDILRIDKLEHEEEYRYAITDDIQDKLNELVSDFYGRQN